MNSDSKPVITLHTSHGPVGKLHVPVLPEPRWSLAKGAWRIRMKGRAPVQGKGNFTRDYKA